MAEAIAIVGLIAAIGDLVKLSGSVVSRIIDYNRSAKSIPRAFKNAQAEIVLVIDALKRISDNTGTGGLNDASSRALAPVIENCHETIQSIEGIIAKVIPLTSSSSERSVKAILSLRQEKKLEKALTRLRQQLALLGFHTSARFKADDQLSQEKPPVFLMPFERDKLFLDRPGPMQTLERVLESESMAVLAGLGGVGKSQLAIEFCYRFRESNPKAHVLWQQVNNSARAEAAWSLAAKLLEIPGHEQADADTFNMVYDFLSTGANGQWLMVLDNADDENILFGQSWLASLPGRSKNLFSCLPRSEHGRIVVTTRDRRIGDKLVSKANMIDISTLELNEALKMLRSNMPETPWNGESACKLVSSLELLPLAIIQAAAFIRQNGISIDEYIQSLNSDEEEVTELLDQDHYDIRRDQDSQTPVLRTWRLSFELIQRQRPRAIELLSLMAVIDRHGVQRDLLQRKGESRVNLNLAFGILQAFSLVQMETDGQSFSMHRLVHMSTQAWLAHHGQIMQFKDQAVILLLQKFPSSTMEHYAECVRLAPHAQVVIRHQIMSHDIRLEQAALLLRLSDFDSDCGHYDASFLKLSEASEIFKQILGTEHSKVLDCLTRMGDVEEARGRYQAAEEIYQRVYDARVRTLGGEDLLTLQGLNHVGGALWCQGKYEAAKEIFELAWKSLSKTVGPQHPDTLHCLQNLATTYEDLGHAQGAEEMHRKVLEFQTQGESASQPEVAITLGNLASALHGQGQLPEATDLKKEAWKIMEASLGPHDPTTLNYLGYYATSLWHEGKSAEAESLHGQALLIRSEFLPLEHLDVLQNTQDLTDTLITQKKYQEAEYLLNQVIGLRSKIMGTEHPKTMESMSSLAALMHLQGRQVQCEEMRLRLLDMSTRNLGPHHPLTLKNMGEVAGILWSQEKFAAALEMQVRELDARTRAHGPSHPETLLSMDSVIDSMWRQGKLDEAAILLRKALRLREVRYGEENEETLVRMTRLASLVRIQGQKKAAVDLYSRALAIYEKQLGADDPATRECAAYVSETLAEEISDVDINRRGTL